MPFHRIIMKISWNSFDYYIVMLWGYLTASRVKVKLNRVLLERSADRKRHESVCCGCVCLA